MKFITFSDLHIHNHKNFARPAVYGLNSRALDALSMLYQIRDLAKSQDIQHVLFCGDLFHSRGAVSTSIYEATYRVLADCSDVTWYMIPGNHDCADSTKDSALSIRPFEALPHVKILLGDHPVIPLDPNNDEVHLFGLGSNALVGMDNLSDAFANVKPGRKNVLLLHAALESSKLNDTTAISVSDVVKGRVVSKGELRALMKRLKINMTFVGDIHLRQKLAPNIWVVGSVMQQDFGEEGQAKGVLIYDTKSDDVEFVPLVSSKFVTLKDANELSKCVEYCYYRITAVSVKEYSDIVQTIKDAKMTFNVKVLPPQREAKQRRSTLKLSTKPQDILTLYVARELGIEDKKAAQQVPIFADGLRLLEEALHASS